MTRNSTPFVAGSAGYPGRYPQRPIATVNLLVVLWRWRYEAGALAAAAASTMSLASSIGLVPACCAITSTIGVALAWPQARRLILRRAWCVITAHRVRTGCAQAYIRAANGKLPILLTTRPRPFGQQVIMWCRAGTCAEDFAGAAGAIAAACWATEVRVSQHSQRAQLVRLDIIRPPGTAGASGFRPPSGTSDSAHSGDHLVRG